MHSAFSPLDIVTGMIRAWRPLSGDTPPGAALDDLLHGMLSAFVAASHAARAGVILLLPGDEAPRLRAVAPDVGKWDVCGEKLRDYLHPGPPHLVRAQGGEASPEAGAVFFGDPDHATGTRLAVAAFGAPHPDGGEARGAFAAEIASQGPGLTAMPVAAELLARAVESGLYLADLRAAQAAETVALRSRVLAGFAEAFGPGGCPGLAGVRLEVERAAREPGTVLFWGEPGTGKAQFARLIHELSPRAARPFAAARAEVMEEVFGRDASGAARLGAVEDAAGGTLYVADVAALARDPAGTDPVPGDAAVRLVRLVREGWFTRRHSAARRRARVRVILGSSMAPEALRRRVPELTALLGQPETGDGGLRTIRLPSLRERPDDVPILLQRAVELLAGRAGERLSFTPRAVKALRAYPWPGNDAEALTLAAEALLSRTGRRLDVGDLPARTFSLPPGGDSGPDGAKKNAPSADTLWDMEKNRVRAALERHGWVRIRAAQELGLTPRQLGWRMKRHGLRPQDEG
ncbi:helix-turn-helix domain-containing protein [Desulfolutivibrio sp.]|uniref:helix-turn-helix domain-containing protein n=1 Tax=Desulfolutivibrio sp. TaxID=2773296 RepID=UPI002F969061